MAFGTGHHGTTHGLLAEMAEMTWDGLSVLDMGCGSGVLAIYAALRGLRTQWPSTSTRGAFEILLKTSCVNGREEGRAFNLREGGADQLTAGDHNSFDVVIANINRNILLEDMAAYCRVLKPSGTLMLSGFMEPDVEILRTEAAQFGLHQTGLRAEQDGGCSPFKGEADDEAAGAQLIKGSAEGTVVLDQHIAHAEFSLHLD